MLGNEEEMRRFGNGDKGGWIVAVVDLVKGRVGRQVHGVLQNVLAGC